MSMNLHQKTPEQLGSPEPDTGASKIKMLAGVAVASVVALIATQLDLVSFPKVSWFDGGKDDPTAKGDIIYEDQEITSISEVFQVVIGEGHATVFAKTKRNHDKPGGLFSGDFQSTNGTSHLRDPNDKSEPAKLDVTTQICSDGLITAVTSQNPQTNETEERYIFDFGEMYVCDATLDITNPDNAAAFQQDDSPAGFHGDFVALNAQVVETVALAASCPEEEMEQYADRRVRGYIQEVLAEQFGVDKEQIEVVPGEPGETSDEYMDELEENIENFTQGKDENGEPVEQFSVSFLSGEGTAIEDSCARPFGGELLEDITKIPVPTEG